MWEVETLIKMATMSPEKGSISFFVGPINFYGNSETVGQFFASLIAFNPYYWASWWF